MVDIKTEERQAHEHEILLGKYEKGSRNIYFPLLIYMITQLPSGLSHGVNVEVILACMTPLFKPLGI